MNVYDAAIDEEKNLGTILGSVRHQPQHANLSLSVLSSYSLSLNRSPAFWFYMGDALCLFHSRFLVVALAYIRWRSRLRSDRDLEIRRSAHNFS